MVDILDRLLDGVPKMDCSLAVCYNIHNADRVGVSLREAPTAERGQSLAREVGVPNDLVDSDCVGLVFWQGSTLLGHGDT